VDNISGQRYHSDSRSEMIQEAIMPHVLVRDLSDRALELLKDQARSRGRSLQAELKQILEQAAQAADVAAARALADQIRQELAGRTLGDSTELVAEDRAR
jgi:plasmid stability protein